MLTEHSNPPTPVYSVGDCPAHLDTSAVSSHASIATSQLACAADALPHRSSDGEPGAVGDQDDSRELRSAASGGGGSVADELGAAPSFLSMGDLSAGRFDSCLLAADAGVVPRSSGLGVRSRSATNTANAAHIARQSAKRGENDPVRCAGGGGGVLRSEEDAAVAHIAELFGKLRSREAQLSAALSQSEYEREKLRHELHTSRQRWEREAGDLREAARAARDEAMLLQRELNLLRVTADGADAEVGAKADVIKRLQLELGERAQEVRRLRADLARLECHAAESVPATAAAVRAPTSERRMFVVTGLRSKEKREVERFIESLGGETVECAPTRRLPPGVTHVVAGSLTPKVAAGMLSDGVWVVAPQFVYKSVSQRQWLCEDKLAGDADEHPLCVRGCHSKAIAALRQLPVFASSEDSQDPGNAEVIGVLRSHGIAVESGVSVVGGQRLARLRDFVEQLRPRFLAPLAPHHTKVS